MNDMRHKGSDQIAGETEFSLSKSSRFFARCFLVYTLASRRHWLQRSSLMWHYTVICKKHNKTVTDYMKEKDSAPKTL